MKFFKYEITNPFKKEAPKQMTSVANVQFALPELPIIREVRGKEWIYYGEDNLYPQHLKRIVSLSPTQGAIIKGKAGMMSGDGLLINDSIDKATSKQTLEAMPIEVQNAYSMFLNNENGNEDLESIITNLCRDYETFGAFSLEVVWSLDWTKIVTLKYVDVSNIRSGKYVNGKIRQYWYSRDWFYWNKEGFIPQPIAAFDVDNRESYNQLIYVKNGNLEYYGEPAYSESIASVQAEGLESEFMLSNLTNGFSPSMALKFYQKPGSPEEQKTIIEGIKKQYAGVGNTGRAMVFFSDGKDNAPDIDAVPVSDLDKQFSTTDETVVQKILTGNQVTSPLLFGISTPGQLGGNTELAVAYQIFNRAVMEPDRKKLEKVLNKILAINQIPIVVNIQPFNPLVDNTVVPDGGNAIASALNTLSPLVATKVLESMSEDEIRDIIGLKPNPVIPPTTTPNTNTEPQA